MSEPSLDAGQVWHFSCPDLADCDDYYLLLRPLIDSALHGMWEAFDLTAGELTYVCPCSAGEWALVG